MIGPDDRLPPLRQDLRILPAARLASGAPGWVIFDPVSHRYFQIGQGMVELLGDWSAGSVTGVISRVQERFGRVVEPDEILALRGFLAAHELLETSETAALIARQKCAPAALAAQACSQLSVFPNSHGSPSGVS